jgi:hypothetical protein
MSIFSPKLKEFIEATRLDRVGLTVLLDQKTSAQINEFKKNVITLQYNEGPNLDILKKEVSAQGLNDMVSAIRMNEITRTY